VIINNPTAPCICCHTTLWNINVRKQAINDKLQRSVATYLRSDVVVNNRIKTGSLRSLSVNFFNRWIFHRIMAVSLCPHFVANPVQQACGLFLPTSHVAWSACLCLSVCWSHWWALRKRLNRWKRGLIWAKETTGCTLQSPGEYDWTIHVQRRCGLMSYAFVGNSNSNNLYYVT